MTIQYPAVGGIITGWGKTEMLMEQVTKHVQSILHVHLVCYVPASFLHTLEHKSHMDCPGTEHSLQYFHTAYTVLISPCTEQVDYL